MLPLRLRVLVETEEFGEQRSALGDLERVDMALSYGMELIARNAERFPVLYEPKQIRMMRLTGMHLLKHSPPCNVLVYFAIRDAETVDMIYILKDDPEP